MAKQRVVVEFSVVDKCETTIRRVKRLCSGRGRINHAQASMRKNAVAKAREPGTVGPAMAHEISHSNDLVIRDRERLAQRRGDTKQSAHAKSIGPKGFRSTMPMTPIDQSHN